jgi:hypothetical protein
MSASDKVYRRAGRPELAACCPTWTDPTSMDGSIDPLRSVVNGRFGATWRNGIDAIAEADYYFKCDHSAKSQSVRN